MAENRWNDCPSSRRHVERRALVLDDTWEAAPRLPRRALAKRAEFQAIRVDLAQHAGTVDDQRV